MSVRPALLLAVALAWLVPASSSATEPSAGTAGVEAAFEPTAESPESPASPANVEQAGPAPGSSGAEAAHGPPEPGTQVPPVVEPRRPGNALFYFFSPDWRPPDFSKLTFAVEQALASGSVDVSFQAFTRYEDFERQVRLQPPTFMIAPAWLEAPGASPTASGFAVIARPLRHGRNVYRKALMTRTNADSIDDLARGSIAATLHSMGSGDPAAVLDTFRLAAGTARIVPVPKDIDALLALSFGQVDAALVTSEQYEHLARTSPAEAERLRVLAFSSEVGLPPVFASVQAAPSERDRLTALLVRLREVPAGADLLAMLGFDGFESEQVVTARREAEADQLVAGRASSAAAEAAAAAAQTEAEQAKAATGRPSTATRDGTAARPAPAGTKPVATPARPAKKTAGGTSGRRS